MTTLSLSLTDSATMLRRNLRHALRYPSVTISTVAVPILFLLLFVGVFGAVMGAGLGKASRGVSYIDYITPGILIMTVATGCTSTAIAVCTDMTEGIINRFRTMAISRASLLTGHVVGSLIQTILAIALVIGVALLMGFRPNASPAAWAEAFAVLLVFTVALTWMAVALALLAKSPENASNVTLVFILLPFISSAFVPTASMPAGVAWFAAHQPFTPIMETVRSLLMGTPVGSNAVIALAWCAVIAIAGYVWAKSMFGREVTR